MKRREIIALNRAISTIKGEVITDTELHGLIAIKCATARVDQQFKDYTEVAAQTSEPDQIADQQTKNIIWNSRLSKILSQELREEVDLGVNLSILSQESIDRIAKTLTIEEVAVIAEHLSVGGGER